MVRSDSEYFCQTFLLFFSSLFREMGLQPSAELLRALMEDVTDVKKFLRNSAAAALGTMLPNFPKQTAEVVEQLIIKYNKNVEVREILMLDLIFLVASFWCVCFSHKPFSC